MINLKAIACEGTDEQAENRKHCRVPERIPERTVQILIGNQCFIILQKISTRNQFSSDYIHAHVRRRAYHVVQREDGQQ